LLGFVRDSHQRLCRNKHLLRSRHRTATAEIRHGVISTWINELASRASYHPVGPA